MANCNNDKKENSSMIFKQPTIVDAQIAIEKIQRLSPAQKTVLNYLTQGFSNKEIANELLVTPETIKVHCSDIFKKLNVTNRTQAALLGYLKEIKNLLHFPENEKGNMNNSHDYKSRDSLAE